MGKLGSAIVVALALVACTSQPPASQGPGSGSGSDGPTGQCGVDPIALGTDNSTVAIGPDAFGTTGRQLCLELDTHGMYRAHLMADTTSQAGDTSAFAEALTQVDGTLILAGWDVGVGDTDTHTFENLEWSPDAGQDQTYSVVLTVAAKSDPAATTTVTIGFFDPLE